MADMLNVILQNTIELSYVIQYHLYVCIFTDIFMFVLREFLTEWKLSISVFVDALIADDLSCKLNFCLYKYTCIHCVP